MTNTVKIIKINPWNEKGVEKTLERMEIEKSLEAKQNIVKGQIELLAIAVNGVEYDLYFNEEGKYIEELTECMALLHEGKVYDIVMGPIIVTKANELGEDIGLTDEDIANLETFFNSTFALLQITKEGESKQIVLPTYSF